MSDFDYVIIGCSAAGVGGVEGIRGHDPEGSIAVVGEEGILPYCRCLLPGLIEGKVSERGLSFRPAKFFEKNKAEVRLGQKAVGLDIEARRVLMEDGSRIGYRCLLLATGSSALLLDLPGRDLPGSHVLRTVKDAQAIIADASSAGAAVVVGGGLVGINTAIALCRRGVRTSLVVSSPQVLSQNLDRGAAEIVARHLSENGIQVLLGTDVVELVGQGRVESAMLSDGRVLACEIAISAKGVRANSDLASAAGIEVDRGVLVDDRMMTSAAGVFAAGDVAEARELIGGGRATMTVWPVAVEQGRVAGENMAGADVAYPGGVMLGTTDFFGLPVVSIGDHREPQGGHKREVVLERDDASKRYRKLVRREGRTVGAILVGGLDGEGPLVRMPCTRVDMREVRDLLLKEGFDFEEMARALLTRPPSLHEG